MRTTRTTAAAVLLAAAVAGCTSSPDPKPAPSATPPSPSPSASTLSLSLPAHKAWCTEALVERHAGKTGPLQSDPQPVACLGLENSDFLDAYQQALIEVSRRALEARQSAYPTG